MQDLGSLRTCMVFMVRAGHHCVALSGMCGEREDLCLGLASFCLRSESGPHVDGGLCEEWGQVTEKKLWCGS